MKGMMNSPSFSISWLCHCCKFKLHKKLFFRSEMHQNRWRLGLRSRPRWGSLQRSLDPLAVREGEEGRGGEGRGGEGRGGEGREGRGGEGRGGGGEGRGGEGRGGEGRKGEERGGKGGKGRKGGRGGEAVSLLKPLRRPCMRDTGLAAWKRWILRVEADHIFISKVINQ